MPDNTTHDPHDVCATCPHKTKCGPNSPCVYEIDTSDYWMPTPDEGFDTDGTK